MSHTDAQYSFEEIAPQAWGKLKARLGQGLGKVKEKSWKG